MNFPFTLESPSDWLNFVPKYLLEITTNSEYVNNDPFHEYLAIKLMEFFPNAPSEFIKEINSILAKATDAGIHILLSTLLRADSIWPVLAQDINIHFLLSKLVLSTDKMYTKNAMELLKELGRISKASERKLKETVTRESTSFQTKSLISNLDHEFDTILSDDSIEKKIATPTEKKVEKEIDKTPPPSAPIVIPELSPSVSSSPPSPPPPPLKPTTTAAINAPEEISTEKSRLPRPATPILGSAKTSQKTTTDFKTTDMHREVKKSKPKIYEKEIISPDISKGKRTIHTHVHYYSRMNPRKTYPFTVTLSSLAKKIRQDTTHLFSGEKESESGGEFELSESVKQIIVEPLLSGCLVQPTMQFVNFQAKNLSKELTFYITPLVEPGLRPTHLNGSLFIKDEKGTLLFHMKLPELSVASARLSQITTLFGIIAGGAIPTFDYLFGTNIQKTLVNQLTSHFGSIVKTIDMGSIVLGVQASIFAICVGGGFMFWWLKGRAKTAPEQSMAIQIP